MERQKVSVVITAYNSNIEYLEKAIESALEQSYQNKEIILIDDGSREVAIRDKFIKDTRIKYIYQDNKGLPGARNRGVMESNGEFIAFLDDDDYWEYDKIEKQMKKFQQSNKGNLAAVFTNRVDFDEITGEKLRIIENKIEVNLFYRLLWGNCLGAPSSVMIKKEAFNRLGGFDESYRYAEDIEFWYRLSKQYEVDNINEVLLNYRVRKNSLSKNHKAMMQYYERALIKTIDDNKEDNYIKENANKILSYFYIRNGFNRYYHAKDYKNAIQFYNKSLKLNKYNIFKIKYFVKYIICISKKVDKIKERP